MPVMPVRVLENMSFPLEVEEEKGPLETTWRWEEALVERGLAFLQEENPMLWAWATLAWASLALLSSLCLAWASLRSSWSLHSIESSFSQKSQMVELWNSRFDTSSMVLFFYSYS